MKEKTSNRKKAREMALAIAVLGDSKREEIFNWLVQNKYASSKNTGGYALALGQHSSDSSVYEAKNRWGDDLFYIKDGRYGLRCLEGKSQNYKDAFIDGLKFCLECLKKPRIEDEI